MKIAIVDYGMGNIQSINNALNHLGVIDVIVTSEFETLNSADKIILPGVGSFGKAIHKIKLKKIDIFLNEIAVKNKKPLLGICLGMQLLGKSSTEEGCNDGLGFIDGSVIKFENTLVKVPHVGFNQVKMNPNSILNDGLKESSDFYFTHSYKMLSESDINQSYCNYNGDFIASFEVDNIAGVQFHPELSQTNGLRLLKNFIEKF